MDGVCPQRHGGAVEQLKQQMDRDIECQRIPGQCTRKCLRQKSDGTIFKEPKSSEFDLD